MCHAIRPLSFDRRLWYNRRARVRPFAPCASALYGLQAFGGGAFIYRIRDLPRRVKQGGQGCYRYLVGTLCFLGCLKSPVLQGFSALLKDHFPTVGGQFSDTSPCRNFVHLVGLWGVSLLWGNHFPTRPPRRNLVTFCRLQGDCYAGRVNLKVPDKAASLVMLQYPLYLFGRSLFLLHRRNVRVFV